MLLAVRLHVLDRVHAVRDEVIRVELAEVLRSGAAGLALARVLRRVPEQNSSRNRRTHLVERAQLDARWVLLPALLGDRARHIAAARIDGLALLLAADRGVQAEVLARRETDAEEVAVVDAVHFLAAGVERERSARCVNLQAAVSEQHVHCASTNSSESAHRYCIRRLSSASAFSISGTVREQ